MAVVEVALVVVVAFVVVLDVDRLAKDDVSDCPHTTKRVPDRIHCGLKRNLSRNLSRQLSLYWTKDDHLCDHNWPH